MSATLDLPPRSNTIIHNYRTSMNEKLTQYDAVNFYRNKSSRRKFTDNKRGATASETDLDEQSQYSEDEIDVGNFRRNIQNREIIESDISDGETIRMRSELSRHICGRIKNIIPRVGDLSLATYIQLLKRDLSKCHDALSEYPTESNFLSIIVLIEAAMSQKKWREFSVEQFEQILEAINIGYQKPKVHFSDYDSIRKKFSQNSVDTFPSLDLD